METVGVFFNIVEEAIEIHVHCTCTYICKVRISTHIIYSVCTSIYYTCTVIQSAFNSEVQMSIGKCIGPINGG